MPTTTWKQDRGRLARLCQDLPADHPSILELRGELRTKRLAEHVAKIIDEAPPLTAEQRTRIAGLLRPARTGGAA